MNVKILKQQNVSRHCIVCGLSNIASLRAQFLETEGGLLIGVPNVLEIHQSYPNRMHGGIISALLDETIGRAVQVSEPETWGVTAGLEIRYVKPVPLDEQIYVTGIITKNGGRIFEGSGRIYLASTGELLASAEGKYVKLPVDKIADANFLHTQWFEEKRAVPDISGFTSPKCGFHPISN